LKKNRKIWVAENPERLMTLLKEREAALKSIMPELKAKLFGHGVPPIVRLYTGAEQIKNVLDEMIAAQRHILAIVDWDDWRTFIGEDIMDDFIEQRRLHFLNIKLLAPKTPLSVELKSHDEKDLRRTRFLPQGSDVKTSHFIFGNTLAIISLNKRQPTAIVIEDPDVAHTATISFEALWQVSSDK